MSKKLSVLLTLALVLAIIATGFSAPAVKAQTKPELQIIWFAWPPCEALGKLAATYPDAKVTVKCIPIGQWHDQIFTDFVAKGGSDLVILDSQWIGEAAKGGHVLDLTEWMKTNMDTAKFVPAALSAYGEYPLGSGKYYGAAAMADVQVLVYRKDIYEANKLTLPKTWDDLLKNSETLKAAKINGFTWFWCGAVACYDVVQTAWNQIAWSYGGELWDPKTYKVEGILNSADNVKALEYAAKLYKTGPEGAGNYGFDQVVTAICGGTAASTIIWIGFGPAFLDEKGCKESKNIGFAVAPAGPKSHTLSLGGMGISISSYTKNKEAAQNFLKWFESMETQLEWVKLGGYSARTDVLDSDTFKKAAVYNEVFAESYKLVKDFWNLPEYSQMLAVQGEQLNLAITGQISAKEALDKIAKEQQAILDKAYPGGPAGAAGAAATKAK